MSEKKHGTIFDDVFRTMVQKMPQLLIPVINEVFQTDYTDNEPFRQLRNEQEEIFGRIITDSIIEIRGILYHIECQSTDDSTMILRMIEYDFAIALEQTFKKGKPYEMTFPKSCVIYIRHGENAGTSMSIKVNLPGGKYFMYETPVVNVQSYTKDEIFQKNLLFFLPYYIMRYEKQFPNMQGNQEKLEQFLVDFEDIRIKLENELLEDNKSALYADLISLITTISDYLIPLEDIRERLGDVMGGQILELKSEQLLKEGVELGKREGLALGKQEGLALGKQEGLALGKQEGLALGKQESQLSIARNMLADGLEPEVISKYVNLSVDEIANLV